MSSRISAHPASHTNGRGYDVDVGDVFTNGKIDGGTEVMQVGIL